MVKDTLNICIVGLGRISKCHLKNLENNRRYKILYVVDPHIDKCKQEAIRLECDYSDSLDKIITQKKIDAVFIFSTTITHYKLAKLSLQNHKHVFVEKPIGNQQEIEELFKLAKEHDKILFVGYQKRFDKNYCHLKHCIQQSKPISINITSRDNPSPSCTYLKYSNGIVEDMLSHDIDIANLYMNFETPLKVVAFYHTESENLKDINEIEYINVMISYKSGTIVTLNCSRNSCFKYDQRVEIYGDFGMLLLENQKEYNVTFSNSDGTNLGNSCESFPERYHEAYQKEVDSFYEMVVGNREIEVTQSHLILNKRVCDAINQSIRDYKVVYLEKLRNYQIDTPQYNVYRDMHINQTYDFAVKKLEYYKNNDTQTMTIQHALELLDGFVDPSDPDLDLPNSIHAYQTAERIRKDYPEDYEFQVCGLIHDLGKVLFSYGEPSWCVVGDTYPLGCQFSKSILYYETLKENSDFKNDKYQTKLGIYQESCGLKNVIFSFGHDEYLYQILLKNQNKHKLTDKYMNIIRYHSFYPWHSNNEYMYLMDNEDETTLKNVRLFNKYDLYSKEDNDFISDDIQTYYYNLLNTFFPQKLSW